MPPSPWPAACSFASSAAIVGVCLHNLGPNETMAMKPKQSWICLGYAQNIAEIANGKPATVAAGCCLVVILQFLHFIYLSIANIFFCLLRFQCRVSPSHPLPLALDKHALSLSRSSSVTSSLFLSVALHEAAGAFPICRCSARDLHY